MMVYIIEEDLSEYSAIIGVFASKEDAQDAKKRLKKLDRYRDLTITEWDLINYSAKKCA